MKKYIPTFALIICAFSSFAQTNNANSILIRHDTTILKADECEWIIKSLAKNNPALTSEIGKPVTLIILEAIEKGKLKAIDPETNKPIPAKEIFTWKMSSDTIAEYDNEGNIKGYRAMKHMHSVNNISELMIFQDWYFNAATGKFHAVIKWIELRENIFTSQGIFLGTTALCRIYY